MISELLKKKKILLAHSNSGIHSKNWHERREEVARGMGYKLQTFSMSELHPKTIFPKLDKKWRKRDPALMHLYDCLGAKIAESDIFVHFNGYLIHPEFLEQFKQLKVFHCGDDPDASNVVSKPVANSYDIHAISNPACIGMYRSWGCNNVFFHPLGAVHYNEKSHLFDFTETTNPREVRLVFVGSKYGVSKYRYVARIPFIQNWGLVWSKKRFFERIEKEFPFIEGYGYNWEMGRIEETQIPLLYSGAQVGVNVHNSCGPVNHRLYDLAAFGVCQICDNKSNLDYVFQEGSEVVGYDTLEECIDLIRYYLAHPEEARKIGECGRQRFLRDYTMQSIWENFFENISYYMGFNDDFGAINI